MSISLTKKHQGFTLIELLIVIAITAILSTLGVGNFISSRIKAIDLARKSDLQTVAKSLEAYVNDHRSYPLSDASFRIICKTDGSVCDWGSVFSDTAGTVYAAKLPADPRGHSYHYSSSGTAYTLYARLDNSADPSIASYPGIMCGTLECNYKLNSSNQ